MSNLIYLLAVIAQLSCFQQDARSPSTDVEECDNPDAPVSCSFRSIPDGVTHVMKISHKGSGIPMVIKGIIQNASGTPLKGVTLYAYHTDENGIYSKNGNEQGVQKWHGQHHGWLITNGKGEYEIHTIRPGKYPNSNAPAHIHAAVKRAGNSGLWISDFVFKDDPDVKTGYSSSNPGGSGVVDVKLIDGKWIGTRKIIIE